MAAAKTQRPAKDKQMFKKDMAELEATTQSILRLGVLCFTAVRISGSFVSSRCLFSLQNCVVALTRTFNASMPRLLTRTIFFRSGMTTFEDAVRWSWSMRRAWSDVPTAPLNGSDA